jgi:hypothetical protein
MKAPIKLKASDLTWSDYGWWIRKPDGSREIFHAPEQRIK